jgi:glycosyltransferase involved in cell wall biosynthesis
MKMKNPKLSIIIPVYNVEEYLHRCLDSILAQSFQNFEILLVDDGSIDKSGGICDEYAHNDLRVRVFHQKNGGPAVARNLALAKMKGEWVTFIDSDDYIDSDGFAAMMDATDGVDMVISGKIVEGGRHLEEKVNEFLYFHSSCPSELYLNCEIANSRDYIWNRFYKSSIIKEHDLLFERIKVGEDTIFNIDYHKYIHAVRIIPKAYYHYVQNSSSISRGYKPQLSVFHQYINTKLGELKEMNSDAPKEFLTFMSQQRVNQLFTETANLFFTSNSLSLKEKVNIINSNFIKNKEFVEVMRKVSVHGINKNIQRFLILYLPSFLAHYITIISFIKKIKVLV